MLNLKEFRSRAMGLPDLLPWGFLVDDGVVLTKSGGFLAGWSYLGPDLDSATQAELAAMGTRINAALSLGDGWVLNCDAVRDRAPGYAPEGAFPDRTTQLIDAVRRLRYDTETRHYTSRYVLTVTWFPPPDAAGKAAMLFVEGGADKTGAGQRALQSFKDRLLEIEGRLSSFLKIRRLADRTDSQGILDSPLLGFLESCVSFDAHPIRFPEDEPPAYLDARLGRHDFVTGFQPRVDRQHIMAIAVDGFPSVSFPGILDFLSRMPIRYRWSNRFIYLDPVQAEKIINSHRSRWSQKRKSLMNMIRENGGGQATHINVDADNMTTDAIAAIGEASSGAVRFGYYTSVILLAQEDLAVLESQARDLKRAIENQGFGARIEDVNAVEAFLGSMPGDTKANVRRPLVHTLNLAHLLPFTSVWAGPDQNPCPFYPPDSPPLFWASTDGFTPFRVSLHAGDLGHTEILGPTGAGKSTLLALLAAQHFRYPRAQVFAFDKGYSMYPLVSAAGGEHYDIAGEGEELTFCPLLQVDKASERDWAAEWIESLLDLQGLSATPVIREEISRALQQMGANTTTEERTMSHFLTIIQNVGGAPIKESLRYYTLGEPGGSLLDASSDSLAQDVFQVFEIGHLMNKGPKVLMPVLTYLFHRLEQRFRGQPTLLILDEAWVMFGHETFKAKIREWLKVLRKANVAVIFATQSLSDLQKSGIADVVHESCPTKILLPNAEAMTENSRPFYQAMGLNDRQIQILATATPKRQYYMMHPDGRRLFELGLCLEELAFLGASDPEAINRIREMVHDYGEAWPAWWLRERGLPEAASVWESY